MIFLLFVYIAGAFSSKAGKNLVMLVCVGLLIFLLVRVCKSFFKTEKRVKKLVLFLVAVCMLSDTAAAVLRIDWKTRENSAELIGSFSDEDHILDPLFVPEVDAFILTDSPPSGTCASGDRNEAQFRELVQDGLLAEVSFDFEHYSYAFVRGRDQISIGGCGRVRKQSR